MDGLLYSMLPIFYFFDCVLCIMRRYKKDMEAYNAKKAAEEEEEEDDDEEEEEEDSD